MAATADLIIRIVTDTKGTAGLDSAATRSGKFAAGMRKMAVPAGIALGAVVAFGKGAVDAASKTQQAMGAVDSVFGKSAGTIKKWAAQAATSVGLSKSEYGELASVIGAQLKNMGIPMDQVAGKTNDLIKKGADLAATYGGTTAEAVDALGSALRGETDPIERYGVAVKQADIAAQQAKDGTEKLTGAAGKQAKTMALLELVNKQTADAHGQFARESDSAAGSAQIAAAQYENMKSVLGQALLPIMSKVMGTLAKMAEWVQKNATFVQILVGVLASLATAVLVVNAAMKVYRATMIVIQAVQKATWLSNPIFLVIAAIILLVAGIVLLWKKSETFRAIVLAVWGAIKKAATATWDAIVTGGKAMLTAVKAVWTAIKAAVRAVTAVVKAIWKAVWAAASAYVRAYVTVAKAVFNVLKGAIGFVIDAVKKLVGWVKDIKVPGVIKSAFEAIRNAVGWVIDKVKDLIGKLRGITVPGVIKSAFDNAKDAVQRVIDAVQALIGWIRDIPVPHIDWPKPPSWLPGVGGNMAPPVPASAGVAAYRAPRLGATASVGARAGGGVTIINVQGALDPDAVARQIGRLMSGHDRRTGSSGLRRASVVVR